MVTYIFEICGPEYRSKITILACGIPWSVGYTFVAIIAQISCHWWWTMLYLLAITLPFPVLVHYLVPESYLYLYSKGKHYKARKIAEKFPQNQTEDFDEKKCLDADLSKSAEDFINSVASFASIKITRKNSAVHDLFSNKFMICSFILLIIIW